MVLAPLPIALGQVQQVVGAALQRRQLGGVDRPGLLDDPAGVAGRAIAPRWLALMDESRGGEAGVQAGLVPMWADRKQWPAAVASMQGAA